ncbi:MAG TPA: energy transducer TonB, partial [Thermoanaerobaculia bacterium]
SPAVSSVAVAERAPTASSPVAAPNPDSEKVPPTRHPTVRPAWPRTARWWTRVMSEAASSTAYQFSMRRVGESPEFRFASSEAGRGSSALVLGSGILWWSTGGTLGFRYRTISPEAVIPPPVFTETFLSEWTGSEAALETVSGQPVLLYKGPFRGKEWSLWLPVSLELPPLRMATGSRIYENSSIEIGPSLDAQTFSPPAEVEFQGPGEKWTGPPSSGSTAEADKPMTVAGDIRAPVLIKKVEPVYPSFLNRARISGTVMIEAIIGRDGSVREARVIRSAHPLLDEEALKAVRLWIYKPATLSGKPVSVYLTVTITFSLN